jgi:hypothetical protein
MNTASLTHRPQLVYLVFGAETYHQEAVFSIASALSHLGGTANMPLDIQVFSDNPAPYAGLPVQVHTLDDATRKRWSEPHGYHFRTKHVLLRQVLETAERALLIDTDTFFHDSPMALFERVAPGTLLCNAFHAKYGDNRESVLYESLAKHLADKGVADDNMWLLNSGVMGMARQDAHLLDHSIELMDELFPMAQGAYTLEEFCLSVAAYRHVNVRQCPVSRQSQGLDQQARHRPHLRPGAGRYPQGLRPPAPPTAPAALDVQADHPGAAQAQAAIYPRDSLRLLRTRKRVRSGVWPGLVGQSATESGRAPAMPG